mmetsp:Transcript_20874/g.29006  ORF Transcript_20874/g.29006 Transcript_20874/m.29006 type:complete len:260 (-) Transcript_20874:102-881(-)
MATSRNFVKLLSWALLSETLTGFTLSTTTSLNNHHHHHRYNAGIQTPSSSTSQLHMSLKPAAMPLMDSGKALARSGEFMVDLTNGLDLYGGALSASGAFVRNAGDCVAQAAASCRFKTAAELVCDELREAATCLAEATGKLELAVEEAQADKDEALARQIQGMIKPLADCSRALENAGEGIMKKTDLKNTGDSLIVCGENLKLLSSELSGLAPLNDAASSDALSAGQRMTYASEKMVEAGNELKGNKPEKPKGKGWLKG